MNWNPEHETEKDSGDNVLELDSSLDGLEVEARSEDIEGLDSSELSGFESAEILEPEFIEDERLGSIIESLLFASDKPVSLYTLKATFKETNVTIEKIKEVLDRMTQELADQRRGITLEHSQGGYQLRTKLDNQKFLLRTLKAKPFRLSGPALEVLSIVAYKQPVIKSEIDSIRGVESGHLLRALMEKSLVHFGERSELPGKPMTYITSRKFLEIFGLRNLQELPPLSHLEDLLPDGIGEDFQKKPILADLTPVLSEQISDKYSIGEAELESIQEELIQISTTTEFFEKEKERQRQERLKEKAQALREAILMGEDVPERDRKWLIKYDEAQMEGQAFFDEPAAP
ncbi:MAG: SMC-Scp complex subunit ScpB [Bdellovibrio sp.]